MMYENMATIFLKFEEGEKRFSSWKIVSWAKKMARERYLSSPMAPIIWHVERENYLILRVEMKFITPQEPFVFS